MPFRFLTGDTDGVLYAGSEDGTLLFYKDEARNGTPRWANAGSAQVIGSGWDAFSTVITAGDGVLYAIAPNGDLFWFKDLDRNGGTNWARNAQAQRIGTGWDVFTHVIHGDDGVLYAVTEDGNMLFFKDRAQDGTTDWHPNSGLVIGEGWDQYARIMPGGRGAIYAIDGAGNLSWFKHLSRTGARSWANGEVGQQIGTGWGNFVDIVSAGDGVFYAITPDGFMLFFKDRARDGTIKWAFNGAGVTMGGGWTAIPTKPITVQGYCSPLSVAPGQTVQFKVSALAPFDVSFMRLKKQPAGEAGVTVAAGAHHPGTFQASPGDAWMAGCDWANSFSFKVPAGAKSGVYSARCADITGTETHLCFVVKPGATGRGDIAVLANTNTWNAYNDYGGRSKYSVPIGTVLSFERPNPQITPLELNVIDHLLRAELWFHAWLEDEGYSFDVYADSDLHQGITNMGNYKALVLTTHPEYWSAPMLDHLEAYLAGGGSLLYLGGNGIFECVELSADMTTMTCMAGDPTRNRDDFYFRNLVPPRPERAVLGVAYRYDNYMTFGPYQVLQAVHPMFAGTGVANGAEIGQGGINGVGASGWEMDTSMAGNQPAGVVVTATGNNDRGAPPANLAVLARGTNPGFGADLTYYDTPAGGLVLSAGSISFVGSMIGDATLRTIIRNALAACGAVPV
jgi:N,N-dimethylformamidase